jgi:hypothetical protein
MLGAFGRSKSSCAVVAGIQEVPNQCDNFWAMVVNDLLQLVVQRLALVEIGCGENRDNRRHRRILVLQVGTAMNQKGEQQFRKVGCVIPLLSGLPTFYLPTAQQPEYQRAGARMRR